MVGWPELSTIQPGGAMRPSAKAIFSLPSATFDVAKSSTTYPSRSGADHANGLVPITLPDPPNGATTGPELQNAMPIWVLPAMVATYSPSRPMWLHELMETAPSPLVVARSMANWVASCAAGWPNPHPPSTVATAPRADLIFATPLGHIWPFLTQPEYWSSRTIPCESWPTRLDSASE